MAIASFSHAASRFGSPSLSVALAPVQAFMALFMPEQRAQVGYRPVSPCPVQRQASSLNSSSFDTSRQAPSVAATVGSVRLVSRLKIVREFEPGMARSQAGRMVISGRMSDVCAELDRIAQSESSRH